MPIDNDIQVTPISPHFTGQVRRLYAI